MGDLGADVIKVESCQYPTGLRHDRGALSLRAHLREDLLVHDDEPHKRSITLDLGSETGLKLLKRLLADADALIDITPPTCCRASASIPRPCSTINPRLLVVTMPAFGMSGAWSGCQLLARRWSRPPACFG